MNIKKLLFLFFLLGGISTSGRAQLSCPPNVDFELGDLSNWNFYTGTCCPAGVPSLPTPTAAIACRHTLTSVTGLVGCAGPATDPVGGFPVLAPGGGNHSFRLGNNGTGAQAERAIYYVRIPIGVTNYSLVYRYAVVMQDPSHTAAQQPRFTVQAYDSTTLAPVPCASYNYVSGAIPGFITVGSGASSIRYLPWSTAAVDLSGMAGTTVAIEFTTADCSLGGHYGYAYIDLSCGLFQIASTVCDTLTPPTLSAPPGFASYTWYDSSTFSVLYGTTQTITIPYPPGPTTLAVILTPYPGFGCTDTLYTTVTPAHMALNPTNDTAICSGRSTMLSPNATDVAVPLTYSWAPATGLSCTGCANPVASPTVTTSYTVTVTNAVGCEMEHVFNITVLPGVNTNIIVDTPSCNGYSNGSATAAPFTGTAPYYYVWNTAPTQTTATATGLPAGTYTVTLIDALGCTDTAIAVLANPAPRIISIASFVNPTTCLGYDGSITINGGILPDTTYTITYLVDGLPQTRTVTANSSGQLILTGLNAGTYTNITIVGALCPYNVIGPVVLADPATPDLSGVSSNSYVCEGDPLMLFANSTTPGVTYLWEGPGGFTSVLQNPVITPATLGMSGVYSVTVTRSNCFNYSSTLVEIRVAPVPSAASNTPVCSADTLFLSSESTTGATSYQWTGPNFYSSMDQNPYIAHVQTVSTGTYTVAITLNGCTKYATVNVTINQTPEIPILTDTNYCQYDIAAQLSAVGSNLRWFTSNPSDTGTLIAPTPSTIKSGTTTWYVTQTSAEGCTGSKTKVSVRVWDYPRPTISVTDSVSCAGKYMTFTAGNIGEGNDGVTWYFEPMDSIINVNPVYHAFSGAGVYTVTVGAYYKYCKDTQMSKVITIFPYASFDLGADTSICPGGEAIELKAGNMNTFGSAATWKWSTGETGNKIRIVAPGTYFATITVNGCESSDSVIVTNDCYITIPNVFTPNGDGINDFFFPRELLSKGMTKFNMNIYNRWGQLIFTGNALDGRGWDGRFNGAEQPVGVYVYVIDAEFKDGQIENHKGNVTLLR